MGFWARAAVVSAVGAAWMLQGQVNVAQRAVVRVQFNAAAATEAAGAAKEAAASAPAGVPGEPGEAPKPPKVDEHHPGALMDRAADSGAQVYVDDSFASVEKLRTAMRYASQGQNQLAIRDFQTIINDYGQKLVYLNNDSYVSITDYVREKLLGMAAVKDGMYDQLYGGEARQGVEAAVAGRDLSGLIRVCDRYFPATAARDGLEQGAEWYFERGEFAGASRLWQLLLKHPMASAQQRAMYLFRAAVAESLAGNKVAARSLGERLKKDFPDSRGTVDGKEVVLAGAVDEMLGLPALTVSDGNSDEWPAFQGGPSHTRLITVESSIGARLWSVDLEDETITGNKERVPRHTVATRNRFGQPQAPDPNFQELNSYPVISNGTVFIHTGERVVALSINGNRMPLWAYPASNPQPRLDANQQQMMQNMYGGMLGGMVSHDSVAVAGDEVFAVLPAPAEANAEEAGVNRRFGYMMQSLTGNTRMVCLSRQGKELWSTTASKIKLEKPGALSFVGSPIVTQQGVFTMARKAGDGSFTELYLVRLDRGTGAVSWACYLCSASSGSYYMPMILPNIPVPSVVDDMVYICTGQGADCAVDANAGRILWLQITDAAKETKSINQIYNPTVTTTASWKFNPPLVAGDKLIACETSDSSSYLRIYDRWSGKVLHSLGNDELNAMGVGKVDVLAGVIGSTAILIGNNACAVDINTGEKVWTAPFLKAQTGNPQGRPFLSKTALYVPFINGMLNVNPRNGKAGSFWPWPSTEETEKSEDGTQQAIHAKPGNLLVTSEQVIVVNDDEVAGYSKWETARDNRLAKIQEHPSDPEAYLNLAEISFRTDHLDLAEENMKRAVGLANAAESGSGGGKGSDIPGRLYHTNLNFAQQLLGATDTEKRDRGRFYYEQCKLTARDPEQQAEWRLCMAELSLAQKNSEEAALLYNQVLTDPNLRGAPYKRADSLARAGAIAEQLFRTLITKDANGAAIYKRYEDQAAALLNNARANHDQSLLAQVMDGYPNSVSAIAAATDLAQAAQEAHDPANELKALYWLGPRVTDEKQKAGVMAQMARACLALPKPRYGSAIAWAERGVRQYKDFRWSDPVTKQEMTFAALRDQIQANPAAALTRGRAPVLPPLVSLGGSPPVKAPDMAPISADDPPLAAGALLVPVEESPALRRPDLLFVLHNGHLHIFDTAAGAELTSPQTKTAGGLLEENGLELPANQPTVLLGCVGNTAVLVQRNMAIGIDVKSRLKAWQIPLMGEAARPARVTAEARLLALRQRQAQLNGAGFVDPQTGEVMTASPSDSELARQTALMGLGNPGFTTLRLVNDKLIAITGDKISAFNVATGKNAWTGEPGGGGVTIPASGTASVALGNEDVIVAEVEGGEHGGASYVVFDAETGKFRKQFKVDEKPLWRDLSDDGIFFVVSSRAVAAFNMLNENAGPLWERTDLRCAFPGATLVTLDGLVLVNSPSELMCLSAETGERRWPAEAAEPINLVPPGATAGRAPFLRAAVEGDLAIYQSGSTLEAYQTASVPGDHVMWRAEVRKDNVPALASFQTSDAYVVAMAAGPAAGTRHAVDLLFYNLVGGKILLTERLTRNPGDPAGEGPMIRAWQVVDHGIAMEINNNVEFYHGRQKSAGAARAGP